MPWYIRNHTSRRVASQATRTFDPCYRITLWLYSGMWMAKTYSPPTEPCKWGASHELPAKPLQIHANRTQPKEKFNTYHPLIKVKLVEPNKDEQETIT